jgi:UDP-2,3-diacylglucosamine pyrophosphatase LpxH
MHDRLLAVLQSIADVRLIAALKDDRIGCPGANDLRVFVPDIHLLSQDRQASFQYGTNHADLLTTVLIALKKLRRQAVPNGTLGFYVMGDLFDLWREALSSIAEDTAACIRDSHEDLMAALLDPDLGVQFLLGNHDIELYRWPAYRAWERRYYLCDSATSAPRVIILHGDIFDWIECFPDQLQQVVVYFSPVAPTSYQLGELADLAERGERGRDYASCIQAPQPLALGKFKRLANEPIPVRWNVPPTGVGPEEGCRFLDAACREAAKANQQFGLDLRMAVIGHTHQARIAVKEDAGTFFALVDCGAWIEQCTWLEDGQAITAPNAQLAALCDNEIRIYQLAPLSS